MVGYIPNRGDTSTLNIHLKGEWLRKAGFKIGAYLTAKISYCCIALIRGSEKVDSMKHEQESLRQQLRDIKLENKNIKNALRGMTD
ncbi:SymE family type I addiction module toxin [Rahnella laticis]|uniref:SymE family type I addiction module toxin n=1 Tax=Rahnella laticis TaxID=2787622 RepID=UPI00398EED6C